MIASMKTRVIPVILIIYLILLCGSSCSKVKYPSGRDTVESYGDGTFQIVGRNPSGLLYAGEGAPLISCVDQCYEAGDIVYIFGHERYQNENIIYGVIYADSNTIQVHFTEEVFLDDRLTGTPSIVFVQHFSDFSKDVQEIFEKMEKGELGNKMG